MNSRMRVVFKLFVTLAFVLVIFFLRPAFAYEYEVTDLGNLGGSPEGVSARAYGINDSTQVVGKSTYNFMYNSYAFMWQNGTMINLGELSPGSGHSYACDINNQGQVVGSSPYSEGGGGYGGCLWQDGTMTHLVGQGHWTEAKAINNYGQAVGQSMAYNRLDCWGHLWESGTRKNLGSLGGFYTYAEGINDKTQVVGKSTGSDGVFYAFLWENDTMRKIVNSSSEAYDINNSGQVVGVSGSVAFVWENGVIQYIGGPNSGAYAINESGEIVGWSSDNAILWKEGSMIDLNTLIPSGSGWDLLEATGINNNGQIIGNGLVNGEIHAFIMTPANVVPEPSSILLFISGLFGYLWIGGLKKNKN